MFFPTLSLEWSTICSILTPGHRMTFQIQMGQPGPDLWIFKDIEYTGFELGSPDTEADALPNEPSML